MSNSGPSFTRCAARIALSLAVAAVFVAPAAGQRLPDTVVPSHYTLRFTPDLTAATFAGEEEILVRISAPTNTIVLNALELVITEATVVQGAATSRATVACDSGNQQATLSLDRPLTAGDARIRTRFTGTLNGQLGGFYLSTTPKRRYAVTQFEATDARRAFPSFDEPAFKATFDVVLVVDRGDQAISNARVLSDTPGPGDAKHTVTFATTKRMSTYLVAMLVGDFECLEDSQDGVPLRICATPGQLKSARFAMDATKAILAYYNRYYSIRYPFEKLDQIAVADFMAGAMENTGAIVYRETALLIDDATATPAQRREVAEIIAHEVAHQWFGDLVTMTWWNDVWLNEGFASWMAAKPLAEWKPDWNMPLSSVQTTTHALSSDATDSTRPIRSPEASTPEQIMQLFDAITYDKTAAVLRMVEQYIGPETFRQAVNAYIESHAYGNATAEDFWNTLKSASGKPVDAVMRSFVTQPGAPLLSVAAACANGRQQITVAQQRFFADGARMTSESPEVWQIPVCFRTPAGQPSCELLSQKTQVFTRDTCEPWISANADGRGYYRAEYTPELAARIAAGHEHLSDADRLTFLRDQVALATAGRQTLAGYLDTLKSFGVERSAPVAEVAFAPLSSIAEELLPPAERPAFQGWALGLLRPQLAAIGRDPKDDESDDTRRLRALTLRLLGDVAGDRDTIAYLTDLASRYIREPASIDPSVSGAALAVAARHGDAALYDRMLAAVDAAAANPAVHAQLESGLARFTHPELVKRTLQRLLTPAARNQDLLDQLFTALATPDARPIVWSFIKDHFDQLRSRLGSLEATALVNVPAAFCDPALRDDARRFFAAHPVPGAETTLQQSFERADTCIRLREREGPILSTWLRDQQAETHGK
jgi:puromycin-sensitive aminopeptidase